MKRINLLVIAGMACLLLIACTEKSPTTTGQVQPSESQAAPKMAVTTDPQEVDGTLTQTGKGLALVTDTDVYLVTGEDLSDLLGKKVKVTGAIAEVDGGQVIQVMSVIPLE